MKIKILLLILVTILLSSCTTKLVYNHFDWILEWYVEDLVTLNEDQEWQLRDAIESELAWHRKNQLPLYIKTLKDAKNAINSEVTLEFLQRFYYAHEKGWMDLKYQVTPSITQLLITLSNRQVIELQKGLASQEEKLTEKYTNKPLKILVEERTERMIDRSEDWLGDLSKKQKSIIHHWSTQVKPVTEQWMETRHKWQSGFIQLVQEHRQKAEFNKLMLEHFQNSRKYWPTWYQDAYYHNINLTLKMFVALSKELTNDQKETLLGKIEGITDQLEDLYKDR